MIISDNSADASIMTLSNFLFPCLQAKSLKCPSGYAWMTFLKLIEWKTGSLRYLITLQEAFNGATYTTLTDNCVQTPFSPYSSIVTEFLIHVYQKASHTVMYRVYGMINLSNCCLNQILNCVCIWTVYFMSTLLSMDLQSMQVTELGNSLTIDILQ